jgi:uncharacterized protein
VVRWRKTGGDDGVQDLRGGSGRSGMPMGRIGGGAGGLGIVGVIIFVLVSVLGGGGGFSPGASLDPFPGTPGAGSSAISSDAPDPQDSLVPFVRFVVTDVQDSWARQFAGAGMTYHPTSLRLFTGAIGTGCGTANAQTGPFYCPADKFVYLDLGFFTELRDRFGAPGDFAQAYVIAHEFGHHVQDELGTLGDVAQQQRDHPDQANELSVRLELQADCLAGVWAHSAYQEDILEDGDLEEGLNAAASVGDDRLEQQAGQRVDPDSFTHGTSEQRQRWFLNGFQGGQPSSCDTFSADSL